MDEVAALLAGYPFDVLLGSVHWLGAWRFDVLDDPLVMAEWDVAPRRPGVGRVHPGHGGAGRLRGVRRPRPSRPGQDRRAGAGRARRVLRPDHRGGGAVGHGRRALVGRVAEAGGGGVPGPAAAHALRRPRCAPHHRVGRPQPARRGRPGRGPAGPVGCAPGSPAAGLTGSAEPYPVPVGAGRWRGATGDHPGRAGLRAHQPRRAPARPSPAPARHLGDPGRPLLLRPGAPGPDGPAPATPEDDRRWSSSARCGRPTAPPWSSTTWWAQTVDAGRVAAWRSTPSSRARSPGARWCSTPTTSRSVSSASRSAARAPLVAVLARLSAGAGRRPGHLERTYRDLFDRFAIMLAESTFPFPSEEVATEEAPRVGDGVVLVDEEGRVRYASPNATNALHRMGMYSQHRGTAPHRAGHRGVGHRMGPGLGPAGGRGGGAPARRDRAAPLHPPPGRRRGDRLPGAPA